MIMKYAIEVENLYKQFKTMPFSKPVSILNDISFKVKMNERIAIAGPNGSGKTTLLKILATLYLPDGGLCDIFGYDIYTQYKTIRELVSLASIALEFQKKLTLDETLKFFAKVFDASLDVAYDFLDNMALLYKLDDRLETFSEGQKALARIAVGLMKNTPLLLLDEVTAVLDATRKEKVVNYLSEFTVDKTLVMIDHDPQVIERLCDKIMLLKNNGTIFKILSIDDLKDLVQYKYDVLTTTSIPLTEKECNQIAPSFKRVKYNVVKFFAHSRDELEEITKRVVSLEHLVSFEVSKMTLEDVYHEFLESNV